MTRNEKITVGIASIVIIILLMLFRRGSTITNEQGQPISLNMSPMGDVYMSGIQIPSLTLPPRNGPIIWPSFDGGSDLPPLPSNQYTDSISGRSTCACGDGTTSTVYKSAPPPIAPPSLIQKMIVATVPAVNPCWKNINGALHYTCAVGSGGGSVANSIVI